MHTISVHSHLPGEDCELKKSFPFCSWLATFGPCCSFPHRSWLFGSCQGSLRKRGGSKLPSLTEHHSPAMPLGGKIVQTSFRCHDEFSCSYKSAGMGEKVQMQPVVPSIPASFSPLLHPSAHPEHLHWGLLSHCGHQCSQKRKRRQRDEGIRAASSRGTQVPRNELCTGQKYQPSSTDTLPSTHTSLVQTVTANPKIAELDKYREKSLQISERVTNSSAR